MRPRHKYEHANKHGPLSLPRSSAGKAKTNKQINKLEAVLGQLRCEVLPPLSLVAALEQNGIVRNVSLATILFLHSNQAKFHVKPYSAPETEQNKPNFKSISRFGAKWQHKECFPSNGIFA